MSPEQYISTGTMLKWLLGTAWLLPLAGFDVRIANDRTDRLMLSTPTGLVVCVREIGRYEPMFHRYPGRRPILPTFSVGSDQEGEKADTQNEESTNAESDEDDPATP